MKKILSILALALCMSFAVKAQPKAVGVRFGYGWEASYQHYFGRPHCLEANLGFVGANYGIGLNLDASYNFTFARPRWTSRGRWGCYAGPGFSMGAYNGASRTFFNFGIFGQFGIEYKFWFPLQLSVDIRPTFSFYSGGLYMNYYSLCPMLGVRYYF